LSAATRLLVVSFGSARMRLQASMFWSAARALLVSLHALKSRSLAARAPVSEAADNIAPINDITAIRVIKRDRYNAIPHRKLDQDDAFICLPIDRLRRPSFGCVRMNALL
jgi:hypothetical protein